MHPTEQLLASTLSYSRERDYVGWDYSDGTSSRILQALPIENQWVNLLFQETIKRAPINLRPYLLVEQRPNYKGRALFAMANLNAHALLEDDHYLAEARTLVDWLVEEHVEGYSGFCVGYSHDLQGLEETVPAMTPGIVGTTYAVLALLQADEVFDDSYLDVSTSAAEFLFEDLGYTEEGDRAWIRYKPTDSDEHRTINANALGARMLVELYGRTGEDRYLDGATKILNYVVSRQTRTGGWMYRDPSSASHLSMDNHHNGFIIESLLRYRTIMESDRYDDAIEDALAFYRETLFDHDGSPNWDETKAYPKDIHAAAQGILVFSRIGNVRFADRIIAWVLNELYAGNGRFYYRKHRWFTRRYTLMRWCQAWMAYSLSEYLRISAGPDVSSPRQVSSAK